MLKFQGLETYETMMPWGIILYRMTDQETETVEVFWRVTVCFN